MNDVPYLTSRVVLLLLLASGARQVRGQDIAAMPVRVTAVFEDSVYLDKGWTEGVYHGDEVVIYCGQGRAVRGRVQSISSHGARVVPVAGDGIVQVGMHGVVIPQQDRQPTIEAQPRWNAPPHEQGVTAEAAQVDFQISQAGPGAVTRVEIRVTASSGGSIYLDKGRASGLSPGDEVVLFPAGDGIVNAAVQSVSRSSARCTIVSGQRNIDIGTRGQALLPADRLALEAVERPALTRNSPEHRPWTHPPENWDQNQPLLAPAYSREPEERKRSVRGRLFADYLHTWNRSDAWNQYSLGRAGAAVWVENPFRRGGELYIDGEFNRRGVFLADQSDAVDGPGRLDRISYYWGGTDDQPWRVELGRFLSYEIPEFGVVDGTELVFRTAAGHRIGVSAGFLPQPFPNLATRNDVFVAAFSRWVSDPLETLSSALGFQKTWHKGTPDRDLLVWSGDYDPNEHFSLHSTVWGDFYDSHDTLKSTSFEISEAIVQPIIRVDPGHGVGAHVSYVRWPQLLRLDYSPYVEQQIIGDRVLRWGLFTWQDLGRRVRLDGRVDQWSDQSHETGTSWEARVAFRELLFEHGEVALAVFSTDGTYSSGPGGRVSVNRRFAWCFASLAYDIADYKLTDHVGGMSLSNTSGDLLQHAIRANLDFTMASDRSVSIFVNYRFGQSQDAIQAGMFFQKRL
jgi:hypothetical protein